MYTDFKTDSFTQVLHGKDEEGVMAEGILLCVMRSVCSNHYSFKYMFTLYLQVVSADNL